MDFSVTKTRIRKRARRVRDVAEGSREARKSGKHTERRESVHSGAWIFIALHR